MIQLVTDIDMDLQTLPEFHTGGVQTTTIFTLHPTSRPFWGAILSSVKPYNVGLDGSQQMPRMLQLETEIFHGLCGTTYQDEFIFFTSDAPPGFATSHSSKKSIRMEGVWKIDGDVGKRGVFRKLFELEYWYGFGTCTNFLDQVGIKSP